MNKAQQKAFELVRNEIRAKLEAVQHKIRLTSKQINRLAEDQKIMRKEAFVWIKMLRDIEICQTARKLNSEKKGKADE